MEESSDQGQESGGKHRQRRQGSPREQRPHSGRTGRPEQRSGSGSSDRRQQRDGDRPYRGDRERPRSEGERPFRREGERPFRGDGGQDRPRRDGDRPYRGDSDRPRRDGDRPFRSDSERSRRDGDRPFRSSSDRPFRGESDRPRREGEKPFRRDGDRPFRGDSDRPRRDGDRPFRSQSGDRSAQGGERGYRGDSRSAQGSDRPFRSNDGRPRRNGDRFTPRDGESRWRDGDRPRRDGERFGRDGERPRREGDRDRQFRRDGDRPFQRDGSQGRPRREGDRGFGSGQGRGSGGFRSDAPLRDDRSQRWSDDRPRRDEPPLPEDIDIRELDFEVRNQLKTLTLENAEVVMQHLIMASRLIDENPELAHKHALAAVGRASRVGVVRESAGITAYATGDYAMALRELKTFRRISASPNQIALEADSERGLGRPEKALALGREFNLEELPREVRAQLALVLSGARLDLGEPDHALRELEIPELDYNVAYDFSPELFRAYAEVLTELGREQEAADWIRYARRAEVALIEHSEEITVISEELELPEDDQDAGELEDGDLAKFSDDSEMSVAAETSAILEASGVSEVDSFSDQSEPASDVPEEDIHQESKD